MKPAKVRRRLAKGLASQQVVRVWRDAYDVAYINGIVIALTDDWLVMHIVADGVYLDGVTMMRTRDISTVRDGHNDYTERALRALGQPIATFECSSDATTRDLLCAAADRHPLTAFCLGDQGEEQLMIGTLVKAGQKRIQHRFIYLDGTWAPDLNRWRYRQISSIHVGGRYIDALSHYGTPPPASDRPERRGSTRG